MEMRFELTFSLDEKEIEAIKKTFLPIHRNQLTENDVKARIRETFLDALNSLVRKMEGEE